MDHFNHFRFHNAFEYFSGFTTWPFSLKICAILGDFFGPKTMAPPDFFTFFPGPTNGSAEGISRYRCPLFFLVKWGATNGATNGVSHK